MVERTSNAHIAPGRAWTVLALASAAVLLGLFFVLAKIVVLDGRDRLDISTTLRVQSWVSPERTEVARAVTMLGASWFAAIVCGSILLWLAWQRRFQTVLALGGVFVLAKLLEAGLKLGFARPRPTIVPHLAEASGYSFPSGHAMTAVVTYSLLAAVLTSQLRGRIRVIPPAVAVLLVVAIGFSRVYLGVHYLTDVIGGVLAAGACSILAIAALFLLDRPGETG